MTARVAEIADARLRGLPGYRPGLPSRGPAAGKLSSNESPLGTAPAARAALAAAAASSTVSHYPDEQQARTLLAGHAGVEPSRIMLTNGSDEFCYLLANVFLGAAPAGGRVAVLGDPPYQIDATASLLAGATLRRVPLHEAGPRRGAHDLAAMAAAAADAALVWLPSPHNPTGAAVRPAELAAFLAEVPDDCLVVLDEAYRAFADPDLRPDVGELLTRHPNLVVQRTLSKDWGLAGLRAGYVLADPELIASLARARPPFSVNALALAAIVGSVGSRAWRSMVVARVREQRSVLQAELARLGVEHFPSQANFVTARLDPGAVARALDGSGLVVRPGDDLGLPGWVRISIGWAPQMAVLRRALRNLAHLAYSVPARSRTEPAPDRQCRPRGDDPPDPPDQPGEDHAGEPDPAHRLLGRDEPGAATACRDARPRQDLRPGAP
jgi:histidinol-phosphate aminotransferase